MDADLAASLIEYGVLGMWTISLLWRDMSLSKRVQAQQDAFQEQLSDMAKEADEKEHALRDRYDQVIADQARQREQLMVDIISKLERMQEDSASTLTKVQEGLTAMKERYAEERALRRIRDQG
jgi:hypothetical protein